MAGEIVDPVEMLRRLIAFDTTSRDSNLALIHYVRDYLAGHGIDSTLIPNEDGTKANLFATVGPMVEGGVVLSGHTDVVPVDGQPWTTDPWTLTDGGDRWFGRGTCDMKTFSAIGLSMVPHFKRAKLKVPIHFALSYDEEVGCLGAHSLAGRLRGDVPKPHLVVIGEPTMMTVVHAHKGARAYYTTFTGFEAQSSMTHLGVSAVHFAGEFIHFINELGDELEARTPPGGEFEPRMSTINVGTVEGGTAGNILARHCKLLWISRVLPTDDPTEIERRVQDYVDNQLRPAMRRRHADADIVTEVRSLTPAFSAQGNEPAKALARAWSGSNTVGSVSYGTEAGIFNNVLGVPTVVCGPGDIAQAHQPNEFIVKSQTTACETFMRRMVEWAETR